MIGVSRGSYVLAAEQWVPRGPRDTFAFFSDPGNLEKITPPFLGFSILSPLPVLMRAGTLIDYRIRLVGVPLPWRTRIETWEAERSFTDVQLLGPYARWIHVHTFTPENGGTRVRDRVEGALPLALWSEPVHALLVRPTLERIFRHRCETIARLLS